MHPTTRRCPLAPALEAELTALYVQTARAAGPVIGAGVRVGRSRLNSGRAGRGLFATRDFPRGAIVTAMEGTVRRGRGPPLGGASHACTLLHGDFWLDGRRDPAAGAAGGSFANDARHEGPNNARLVWRRRGGSLPLVVVRARRAIPAGAEITVGYGRSYWRRGL